MVKIGWKILLIVIPIVFIIGLFSMAFNESATPVYPSFASLLARFNQVPNFGLYVAQAFKSYQSASSNIHDFITFFAAIGEFFNFLWSVLSVPFQFFGWLFNLIGFSFNAQAVEESASAALPLISPFGVQGGAHCL